MPMRSARDSVSSYDARSPWTPPPTTRSMIRKLHNGHVLGVAAFAAPLMGLYAPRTTAVLVILTAVAATSVRKYRGDTWPVPGHCAVIALAAIVVWSAISLAWTIEPLGSAANGLARLAIMLACGMVVVEIARRLELEERRVFHQLLLAGFALALALVAVERATDFPLRRHLPLRDDNPITLMQSFNRGLTVLALAVFPVALVLWRRSQALALAAWAGTLALLATMHNAAAVTAVAFGGAFAAAAYVSPRVAPIALATALLGATLVAPIAARQIPLPAEFPLESTALSGSAHHRLMIWRFTADRIADRPLFGWGFDASRSIPGGDAILGPGEVALPLHPHNAPLQWWLELGLPGALIGVAFLTATVRAIRRAILGRTESAAAFGLMVSATVMAFVSYGIWQSWWVAIIALSAALLTASAARRVER